MIAWRWLGPLICSALPVVPVARANDYVVIIHPDNTADSLSQARLLRIFKSEVQEWSRRDPIVLLLPKAGSAEKKILLERVYEMDEPGLKKYWTQLIYQNRLSEQPRAMPSAEVAIQVVAKTRGAIAVVPEEAVAASKLVKVIEIDGKRAGQDGYLLSDGKKQPDRSGLLDAGEKAEASKAVAVREAAAPRTLADSEEPTPQDRTSALESRIAELEAFVHRAPQEDTSDSPILSLRGFSHINFGVEEIESDGGTDSTSDAFALGGLDLFVTSKLSDRISFLNETVFEPTDDGEYVLDVERVVLKYHASDALNVHAGRFHTSLGWWNETYHHGEWLQTSVGRPKILDFEDEDGLLPVHLVGLVFKGRQDFESLALKYTLEVGNGRGPTPDPPQITVDANDAKAVNVALSVSPNAVPGLEFGAAFYQDSVPKNTDATAGPVHARFDETIANGFVHWQRDQWQLTTEFFAIDHSDGNDASSTGWYTEIGRSFGKWTPYLRVDGVEIDDDDTYFTSVDDQTRYAVGVRWDVATWNAIKFQVSQADVEAGPGGSDEDRTEAVIQTAFAF